MTKQILSLFYDTDEDLWIVDFPEFPNCSGVGQTAALALINGIRAVEKEAKIYKAKGLPSPVTLQLLETKKYI